MKKRTLLSGMVQDTGILDVFTVKMVIMSIQSLCLVGAWSRLVRSTTSGIIYRQTLLIKYKYKE